MREGSLLRRSGLRRRRLGESVGGCLLMIAIVLGGSIWGYFKFFHYGNLTKAGNNHVVFDEEDNHGAVIEYGRRFRQHFAIQGRAMTKQNWDMIVKFKKGKYKSENAFTADVKGFITALHDSISDFDGQQVPKKLNGSHSKMSLCHKACYESTRALEEAWSLEGAERDAKVKEAESKCKEAFKLQQSSVLEYQRVWPSLI